MIKNYANQLTFSIRNDAIRLFRRWSIRAHNTHKHRTRFAPKMTFNLVGRLSNGISLYLPLTEKFNEFPREKQTRMQTKINTKCEIRKRKKKAENNSIVLDNVPSTT